MKKTISMIFAAALAASMFAGCGSSESSSSAPAPAASGETPAASESAAPSSEASSFDTSRPITVVSREDGSGTRGAFIELFGVQEKKEDGSKVDNTTKEAITISSTEIMLQTVAGDEYGVGYVSLGSLNDSVKALPIDGVEATADNVKNGSYKISRPFNIVTKGEPAGLTKDFVDFIMSKEGQAVVAKSYIAIDDAAPAFAGTKPEGKIVIAGSSSVSPIMEKLIEAYQALNPAATIELQQSDSTAGITAAQDGTCDIGMASRELKDEEAAALNGLAIANDGIAVVVSPANPIAGMTKDQVKAVYTGAAVTWADVK